MKMKYLLLSCLFDLPVLYKNVKKKIYVVISPPLKKYHVKVRFLLLSKPH